MPLCVYLGPPNDHCFDWNRSSFGGPTSKNRGRWGSRYIYIYYNLMIFAVYRKCCVFSKLYHSFPQSRITIQWNHKDSNIPLFLPCISAIFAPCRCNTRQRTIRSSSPETAIHKVEEDKPSEFFVGKCREAVAKTYQWIWMIWIWIVVLQD